MERRKGEVEENEQSMPEALDCHDAAGGEPAKAARTSEPELLHLSSPTLRGDDAVSP